MRPFASCEQKLETTVTAADILAASERIDVTCSITNQLLYLSEIPKMCQAVF